MDMFTSMIYFATVASVLVFMLDTGVNMWNKNKPLLIALIGLFIIGTVIFLYLWMKNKSDDEEEGQSIIEEKQMEDFDNLDTDNLVPVTLPVFTAEKGDKSSVQIDLKKGAKKAEMGIMTYDKFKRIAFEPDFLQAFAKSMAINTQLKRQKYIKIRKQLSEELAIASKTNPPSIIPSPKDESVNMLKTTISEIGNLIQETKKQNPNIEYVKAQLYKCFYDPSEGLDSLVGRQDIKDFIALQLYTFAQNPRVFFSRFQNIALYAPSGYGKTKIASVIAWVYSNCGILLRNRFLSVTKQAMTTAYVNESTSKTRNLLLSTLESVLLIDEAYDLTPPPNSLGFGAHDHGQEAITEMVNFIDKMMGLNIIIVAGYEDAMEERFMNANEGLARRFPHVIRLQRYTSEQLAQILVQNFHKTNPNVSLTDSDMQYMYKIIQFIEEKENVLEDHDHGPVFFSKQGGDMLNIAGDIATYYYGSTTGPDIQSAIVQGFNHFLANKDIHISTTD